MATIDIGTSPADGNTQGNVNQTDIELNNPANLSGLLNTFEVWLNVSSSGATKVGTFSGSGADYAVRDYENLGSVTGGSKQTFTGKSCSVVAGDFIGYCSSFNGYLELSTAGGSGLRYRAGDGFSTHYTDYSLVSVCTAALYATGVSGGIHIGAAAVSRGAQFGAATYTIFDKTNPSLSIGSLATFYAWWDSNGTGCKVGTLYGSSDSWTFRDAETIGNTTSGSLQTYTGKDCLVSIGDVIGYYLATGDIEAETTGGLGLGYKAGDQYGQGARTYTVTGSWAAGIMSLNAIGTELTPSVTTQAGSSVTETTCTGNGTVVSGTSLTERGICYKTGTGQTPTTADSTVHDHTDATGAFTAAITGLTPGTTYSLRAYAINAVGTAYGSVVEITTPILAVSTQAASAVTATTCTGNGTIVTIGDHTADVRGFCWVEGGGTPTTADSHAEDSAGGYGTGAYAKAITGLSAGTTYTMRAYVTDAHRTV